MSRTVIAIFAVFSIAAAAMAGPMDDARTSYKKHDYKAALASLEEAQKQDPNNPLVFAAMGNTYRHLDDAADAKKSYEQVLALDPNLNAIQDKAAFQKAYQSVGGASNATAAGGEPAAASNPNAPATTADGILNALSSGDVFVVPGLQDKVDTQALQKAVDDARPTAVKIAVLAHTGNYPNGVALADDLRKNLNLPADSLVLVGMPNGVSASSANLSASEIDQRLRAADLNQTFAAKGLTGALVQSSEILTHDHPIKMFISGGSIMGPLLIIVLVIVAVVIFNSQNRRREIGKAKQSLESLRRSVIDNLSYVDGYLDLLPPGVETDNAKKLRAGAYESYATANGVFQTARSADEVRRAGPLLEQAMSMLSQCRAAVDKATGGTGVALSVPDMALPMTDAQKGRAYLDNSFRPVEQVASAAERDRYQREVESIPANERGVSFFSGRPMPANQLVPVTMVVGGKKRTVMATREEAAAIARGQTPPVRAFADGSGRYTPWYEYRGYDPYRDYYGGWGGAGVVGDLVDLYLLTSLLGPGIYGGYGPWGFDGYGYGMDMPPMFGADQPDFYGPGYNGPSYVGDYGAGGYDNGGGGYDDNGAAVGTAPDNAGGFDFAGQQDYSNQDQSGGFDVAPGDPGSGFDSGSNDAGGFDFGGGDDSGGFDFGGGDSGGGFDFGGGDGS